ncbi:alpha/beta hydrolase [Myxococcota bacterium]|nr:alpha/beta hydrolase [Myxococcota bacterium]
MSDEPRFAPQAWLPVLSGFVWLSAGGDSGWAVFTLCALPGGLQLASGFALLLFPGDRRITHFCVFGAALGVVVLPLVGVWLGPWVGALLLCAALASALSAGAYAIRSEEVMEEVPTARHGVALWAQVAVDEWMLAFIHSTLVVASRDEWKRISTETRAAQEWFRDRGWLDHPLNYHQAPTAPENPGLDSARAGGVTFEHLHFESGYEPHLEEPGRDRWLSHVPNRTAHAWVLRHREPGRPWLVAIHGYQMGHAAVDWLAFPPAWLHRRLGANLLLPILPLHGPRKIGRRSGDGYLRGDVLDTLHAQTQAIWDIRRMLHWIRSQSDSPVGVLGYSLGGYTASLLASVEPELACVIAGIPVSDLIGLIERHGPSLQIRDALTAGLDLDCARNVMGVSSPLVLEPRVALEHRHIFGASADRLVPPAQVRDLWRHWGRPPMEWYPGGHLTFRAHPRVAAMIEQGLQTAGVAR